MSDFPSAVSESITFKNSQGLEARGTILKISQNYIVFETYNPHSIVQLSEVLDNVRINRINSESVNIGKVVVSSLINTGLLLVVSATLVDSFSRKSQPIELSEVNNVTDKFIAQWQQSDQKIPDGYQLSVSKIRTFLTEANRWIDNLNIGDVNKKDNQFDNQIVDKMAESFLPKLAELIGYFEIESEKIDTSSGKITEEICRIYAQKELHHLLMQSPFFYRCLCKPLGYAGDYEMVNMILRDPHEGETIYAKLINLFFLVTGPAEAHRNRIDILFDKIKETAFKAAKEGRKARIFNFACGPAVEVQRFIEQEELSESCEFILLDFSKVTLDYTANALEESMQKAGNRKVDIKYINKSAHDALKEAVKIDPNIPDENNNFDLVYCAGLFDYLSDKVCSKLLELFYWQLKPGGDVLATNVHINHPVKVFMEHLGEWYLIYRNEDGFIKLVDVGEREVYADKTGYNIFLNIHKLN